MAVYSNLLTGIQSCFLSDTFSLFISIPYVVSKSSVLDNIYLPTLPYTLYTLNLRHFLTFPRAIAVTKSVYIFSGDLVWRSFNLSKKCFVAWLWTLYIIAFVFRIAFFFFSLCLSGKDAFTRRCIYTFNWESKSRLLTTFHNSNHKKQYYSYQHSQDCKVSLSGIREMMSNISYYIW